MNKFLQYLRVQILRAVKLYPAILCFTLIAAVGMSALAVAFLSDHAENTDKTKIEIGLVGDLSDSYLGIGLFAVQQLDASRFYVNFEEMQEEEALEKLADNTIMGYVRVPDDFMESILNGVNKPVTYVTKNRPALLGSIVVHEIASAVSEMLMTAQGGIYGYIDFTYDSTLTSAERNKRIEDINIEYLDLAMDRESLYDLQYVGFGNDLQFELYYTCAFLVIILLLWGIVCVQLTVKTDLSLQRQLRICGHTVLGQMGAEYLAFLLTVSVSLLITTFGVGLAVDVSNIQLSFLPYYETVWDFVGLGLSLLPAVIVVTALQFFLYSLTSHLISAVILQVMSVLSLSLVSGFLFPSSSLPRTLRTIAEYLPTGMAFNYTADVLTGTSATNALWLIVIAAVFLACSVAVRECKLREVGV